jgi:hypothetical protein
LLPAPLRSTHLLKHICHVTPGLQTLSRKVSVDARLHINISTEPAVAGKISAAEIALIILSPSRFISSTDLFDWKARLNISTQIG